MDLNYVKKLVKLLSESDVDEVEIEEEGKKIRLVKHGRNSVSFPFLPVSSPAPFPAAAQLPASSVPAPVEQAPVAPHTPSPAAPSENIHEIRSPIVGTFYRSPAPDASPFVQIGTAVESGSVLCIVEAMKLMNEIESDVAGRIAKILVENGQPVEYDQVLFLVEKS